VDAGVSHDRLEAQLIASTRRRRSVQTRVALSRTTQLYDRRRNEMSLDEVERISI